MTTLSHILKPMRVIYFCVLIVAVHVMATITDTPAIIQLVINSISCVYVGSFLAFRVQKNEKQEASRIVSDGETETMTQKDALVFPVYGSAVLGGIYLLYKFVNKELLSLIFTAHFMFIGIFCVAQVIEIPLSFLMNENLQKKYLIQKKFMFKIPFYQKEIEIELTQLQGLCLLISLYPTLTYIIKRDWIANNIFGIAFSIMGINNLVLPNFKVGYILMWGLFFYDIFWVYGTDVMITVAKSFDAPIKLIFPYEWATNKQSMLGLGDIVIPGVFVALALKYDIDTRLKNFKDNIHNVSTPYFNWCYAGYCLGIITTFIVMVVFNHAQPALLFLVPSCTISVLIKAIKDGKLKDLFTYEEQGKEQVVAEQKKEVKSD